MPRLAELAWGFVLWRERENGASLHYEAESVYQSKLDAEANFEYFDLWN